MTSPTDEEVEALAADLDRLAGSACGGISVEAAALRSLLADRARLTAELREARMQAISDGCQLQEAQDARLAAERELAEARAALADAAERGRRKGLAWAEGFALSAWLCDMNDEPAESTLMAKRIADAITRERDRTEGSPLAALAPAPTEEAHEGHHAQHRIRSGQ